MELTKKDTKMLQGLSVMAMVCLHLFCRYDYEGVFQPLIFIWGKPLSFYFGQLSDFCVMGFAFCSGYAHMVMYDRPDYYKKVTRRLLPLLLNYWIIIVVFSVISSFMGQGEWMPGNLRTFVLNLLVFGSSYNGAWWYLSVYILMVLISPLTLKLAKRCRPAILFAVGFVVYFAAYSISVKVTITSRVVTMALLFIRTLFEYLIGVLACKTKAFTWLYQYWKKLSGSLKFLISLVLIVGMLIGRTWIIPSLFAAPFSGMVIICLFHFWKKPAFVERAFLFVGKHSTDIWLTHMFFYVRPFSNLVYIAKYPVLIFCFMMLLTLALSITLQTVQKPLLRKLKG